MIKINQLRALLNCKELELQKFNIEQLRLLLGIFRYLTRIFEREINQRESNV